MKYRSYLIVISVTFLFLLVFHSVSQAVWITEGEFSEQAGIDSLNMFMVAQDVDTNCLLGYEIINLGDINYDSYSDVLILRWSGAFNPTNKSFLLYGGNPPDPIFDEEFPNLDNILSDVGDINGDGFSDICMSRYIATGVGNVEFYFGGPGIDDSADFIIANIISYIPKAMDLDADGDVDLPLSKDLNDSGKVLIFNIGSEDRDTIPEYIISDTSKGFGNNLATGDFNGDHYPDLAISASLNRDSAFVKFYWGGSEFDTIPDFEIYRLTMGFGFEIMALKDINNDGYDDIFIAGLDSQNPYGIFFGGPDIDNQVDIVTNRDYYGVGFAGYTGVSDYESDLDLNNDGYNDLITGYSADPLVYHEIRVFLGGPGIDSIPDIYLENSHIPGGQLDLGDEVVGIGDFNGDGVDDFAARSVTMGGCCWDGEVNFFAGWDSQATDVDYDYEPSLPDDYHLYQNYPNPFNSETRISFDLPRACKVALDIYNILGMKVRSLIDREFPAGSYDIKWDGVDDNNQVVASGIYFYRLKSGEKSLTSKMVLLK